MRSRADRTIAGPRLASNDRRGSAPKLAARVDSPHGCRPAALSGGAGNCQKGEDAPLVQKLAVNAASVSIFPGRCLREASGWAGGADASQRSSV